MILIYIFSAVVFVNCAYFLLFSRFSFLTISTKSSAELFPISLLVCAKNEADNLRNHIPLWLSQEYPNFELVLINDASYDETLEVMEQFAAQDPRIKIVNVVNNEAFWGSKKYALTLGIKKATHHRMLFTDADCRPKSNNWISEMASQFTKEKQLVLGYGAYEKLPGLLNKLIRFETMMTAIQYFSYAKVGIPYMGVGRNLAYTDTLYYKTNGFMSHMKIASGDDDLFVNEAATGKNTALCISENAFTISVPKKSWKSWIHQKKRHINTSKLYKLQHKIFLGLYYLSNLFFWLLTLTSFFFVNWIIPSVLIGIRLTAHWIIIATSAKKLKENDLIPLVPLLEIFLVFVHLSIFISNRNPNSNSWK